jgi:hypothetical protein
MADMPVSKTGGGNSMRVRLPPSAVIFEPRLKPLFENNRKYHSWYFSQQIKKLAELDNDFGN